MAALRTRLPELDETDRQRVAAWCNWAATWCERSDRTVSVERIRGLDDRATIP